jgi:hypothetical protein
MHVCNRFLIPDTTPPLPCEERISLVEPGIKAFWGYKHSWVQQSRWLGYKHTWSATPVSILAETFSNPIHLGPAMHMDASARAHLIFVGSRVLQIESEIESEDPHRDSTQILKRMDGNTGCLAVCCGEAACARSRCHHTGFPSVSPDP